MSSLCRGLPVCLLASLPLLIAASPTVSRTDGCLFANTDGSTEAERCSDDPLQLMRDPTIANAIRSMGLEGQSIRFEGCERASFATISAPSARELRFVVRYPILRDVPTSQLVAPIVHELSHVVQVREAGSYAKFRAKLADSRRVELGADFLAGVVFANYLSVGNLKYQNSLELVGRYREDSFAAHGTPGQRNAAYRLGAYFLLNQPNFPLDLPKLHLDFQENGYADVVR